MRFYITILLIFNYLTVVSQSDSVPLMFQKITAEQGLPHNFVRSITQDQKGFMWIGTNYGLARFDGYDFKVFLPDPKKPHSISHKSIDNIFADSHENLWISFSSGGISKMDLTTEKFTFYDYDASTKVLLSQSFGKFMEDENSDIWIATSSGIFFYNKQQDKCINALTTPNFNAQNLRVFSFVSDGFGNIWFVCENKVWIFNKKTKQISTFAQVAENKSFDSILFNNLFSFQKGKIWFTTYSNGVLCYDVATKKSEHYLQNLHVFQNIFIDRNGDLFVIPAISPNKLYVCKKENITQKLFQSYPIFKDNAYSAGVLVVDDKFGNVFISSPAGLIKYNRNTGVQRIEANFFVPSSIADNRIECLFIDRTDNLWISPHRWGLNKADLWQKPIRIYSPHIYSMNDIQKDNNISSVFEDSKGHIWMGNSDGTVTIYDKKSGNYYRFSLNSSNTIMAIYEDIDANIYLGSNFEGLVKVKIPELKNLNPKLTLSFSQITRYEQLTARKITSDQNNHLWFAAHAGMVELNIKTNELTNHSLLYDSLSAICDFYRTVFVDNNQWIWAGSNSGGLTRYDKSKKIFKHYLHDKQKKQSISNNTVYAIYKDKEGNLWLGTRQGLEKFNPQTEVFEHKGREKLFNRSIFSILPDEMGNLWMSSDIGIICYHIETQKTSFYGSSDGLRNNELSTTASFMNPNGEIFYGGTEGIISFYPADFKLNQIQAKPVITNLRISNKIISPGDSLNGRVILPKQPWEVNEVFLEYFENEFTIEFSALHYSAPEKIQYQYKLEGLNSQWIYTNANRRYAAYSGLQPGHYTFILRATNNDGLMCDEKDEVRFYITIIPPFWETWWFRVLIVLIIAGSALTFFFQRTRLLKQQKRLLEIKVTERTSDLKKANLLLEGKQQEILQQNIEIRQQYSELEDKNNLIEEKNNELINYNSVVQRQNENIKSSIHYAKTIQNSILPDVSNIEHQYQVFVLYFPKDIVSGDFYWFHNSQLFAVVDCTGHGVPGAFMSVIGSRILNDIVKVKQIYSPAEILEAMDYEIKLALRQNSTNNDDGMDVCLINIQPEKQGYKVEFAGAMRPLFYYSMQNNSVEMVKGTVRAIGGLFKSEFMFQNVELNLHSGDILYLTSDGYLDQPNDRRKTIGTKRFTNLIADIAHLPMEEQKLALENHLIHHSESQQQRDDITLMAIKL